MALELLEQNIANQSGIEAKYWRIISLNECFAPKPDDRYECILGLYLNKAASDAGKQPLKTESFVWRGNDYAAISEAEDKKAVAYQLMKREQLVLPKPQPGVNYEPGYLETPRNVNPFVDARDV